MFKCGFFQESECFHIWDSINVIHQITRKKGKPYDRLDGWRKKKTGLNSALLHDKNSQQARNGNFPNLIKNIYKNPTAVKSYWTVKHGALRGSWGLEQVRFRQAPESLASLLKARIHQLHKPLTLSLQKDRKAWALSLSMLTVWSVQTWWNQSKQAKKTPDIGSRLSAYHGVVVVGW